MKLGHKTLFFAISMGLWTIQFLWPSATPVLVVLFGLSFYVLIKFDSPEEFEEVEPTPKTSGSLQSAKDEFLNLVSHEMRTPLTSIKGSLDLIASEVLGPIHPRYKGFMEIAQTEVKRLVDLVNEILDLSAMNANAINYDMKWSSAREIMMKTQSALLGLQQSSNVGVIVEPLHTDVEVFCDAERIQQLLTNLIANAIRYSPAKGHVWIGVDIPDPQRLRFYVLDEGPGIPKEKQQAIFDRFVRLSQTDGAGTGLGLSICSSIAEAHNGRMGLQSEENHGSLFYFECHQFRMVQNTDLRREAA